MSKRDADKEHVIIECIADEAMVKFIHLSPKNSRTRREWMITSLR